VQKWATMEGLQNKGDIEDVRRRAHLLGTSIELTPFNVDGGEKLEIKALLQADEVDENAVTSTAVVHGGTAPPGTASKPQVATNIIISFIGAGILGMPDAFRQSGWLLGSVSLIVVSALNVYAMLLLPQVKIALLKSRQQGSCNTYGDVGRCVLGTRGEVFVNLCLGISQAGFATAYIIFISANLYSIAKIPRAVSCAACVPGLALLVQFRDMKYLSPFSLLANCANFAALSAVLYQDYESFWTNDPLQHREPIHAVNWDGFLYVIAITIYSMEGVGLVLSLEASCKDQQSFSCLLRWMLVLITLFMAFFGSAGYLAFGDKTVAPITLNLVDHFWSATFVKCGLCLGLYFTYPVMMFPIWCIAESLSTRVRDDRATRVGFRSLLVVLSALVAYGVPDFGEFLSLVGSSICTILGFILPCYFHLIVLEEEIAFWQISLDWFLIVGGTLFGIFGTYNSFVALFEGDLDGHV
jgi:solute carrier family 36 (proton-coupled amino acid transporter)